MADEKETEGKALSVKVAPKLSQKDKLAIYDAQAVCWLVETWNRLIKAIATAAGYTVPEMPIINIARSRDTKNAANGRGLRLDREATLSTVATARDRYWISEKASDIEAVVSMLLLSVQSAMRSDKAQETQDLRDKLEISGRPSAPVVSERMMRTLMRYLANARKYPGVPDADALLKGSGTGNVSVTIQLPGDSDKDAFKVGINPKRVEKFCAALEQAGIKASFDAKKLSAALNPAPSTVNLEGINFEFADDAPPPDAGNGSAELN